MSIDAVIWRKYLPSALIPTPDTTIADSISNLRDVGKVINRIIGKEVMFEERLYRGGSIQQCRLPNECGDPHLIVCLRVCVDRNDWAPVLHYPKPDDLECYSTEQERIRGWIKLAVLGVTRLQAGKRAYVHCRLGRDRTGVVIAAILTALGVPEEAIVEEFLISQDASKDDILRALVGMPRADEMLAKEAIQSLRFNFLR